MNEPNHGARQFCGRTRREFLWQTGNGFGALALSGMLSGDGFFAKQAQAAPKFVSPMAPKPPQLKAKAKSVIFLFMAGGPSQLELFDSKPKLQELDGQPIPPSVLEGRRFAFMDSFSLRMVSL